MKGNYKYHQGQRIESLVLLQLLPNQGWKVKCDCGNILEVSSRHLYRKKSCGCKSKSNRFKKTSLLDEVSRSRLNGYKSGAKQRGLEWSLTDKDFLDMIVQNCFYCNSEPYIQFEKKGETAYLNGIDRLNSEIGYTKENSVPCCTICNLAKSDLSLSTFLSWLKKLKSTDINFEKFKNISNEIVYKRKRRSNYCKQLKQESWDDQKEAEIERLLNMKDRV